MQIEVQGRRAYAYTGGCPFDPALPTVVMVHGALNDHSVWGLHSRWLAHHGQSVLAVDLPGHGRSAGPALESVEAMADWLVALLSAVGARQPALVGHSMGSLIALEAAARLGDAARALVMIGTGYPMKVSPALLETALTAPAKAIDLVTAFSISSIASKPSSPGPGSWLHGGTRMLMRHLQAAYAAAGHGNLFHTDFSACDRYAGGHLAADRVRCPVHLLLGARDSMTPPASATVLQQALEARVVTLASGHALMAESPDALLSALREALPVPAAA